MKARPDPIYLVMGMISRGGKEVSLSAGKLFLATIKGKGKKQLAEEYLKYRKEGKITDDALNSKIGSFTLAHLLRIYDEEGDDYEKTNAIKNIFFAINYCKTGDEDRERLLHLFKVAMSLSGDQIAVLIATHRMVKVYFNDESNERMKNVVSGGNRSEWLNLVAKELGHGFLESISVDEEILVEKKLLSDWQYNDKSGFIIVAERWHLTEMGYQLCESIVNFSDVHSR